MVSKTERKLQEELETLEEISHQVRSPNSKLYFWFGFVTGIAVLAIVGLGVVVFGKGLTITRGGSGGGVFGEEAVVKGEQKPAGSISIVQIAQAMGVNEKKFTECYEKKETENTVNEDYQEGLEKGVRGTPGNYINGYAMPGAVPYEQVKDIIDQLLEGKKLSSEENPVDFSITKDDHVRGEMNAPVTVVEFSDLECPFCARFHPTMQRVMDEYKGKVRWVYKHFPLDSIHPKARPAAIASECVYQQKGDEGFWKFVDEVFAKQDQLSL